MTRPIDMMSPGGISVSPNPAQEGGSVTIKGEPGSVVLVSSPGKNSEIKLDKNGRATVRVPVKAGGEFSVSDGKFPKPKEVVVDVTAAGE